MNNITTKNKERNHSIDICRFISAISVLAIHTMLFSDIAPLFNDIFINIVFSRYVVQFFICITGFYYCKALIEKKAIFKKQFLQMLKTYIVWTIIYYTASFVQSVLMNSEPILQFLVERVLFFFTQGSYPHLWNFPAVLYPMLIITAVFKLFGEKGVLAISLFSIILFCIGVLGTPYSTAAQDIPVLSQLFQWSGFATLRNIFMIGLPFFSLGYLLVITQKWYNSLPKRVTWLYMAVILALYIVEAFLVVLVFDSVKKSEILFLVYPFVGMLFIMLLRNPLPKLAKTSDLLRKLANFVYFVHPLLYVVISLGASMLGFSVNGVFMFFVLLVLSVSSGYILIKINTSWSNTLLGLPTKQKRSTTISEVIK